MAAITALSGIMKDQNSASIRVETRSLKTCVWVASAIVYGLGVLHFLLSHVGGADPSDGLMRVINLDAEAVIPSWYSSSLLLLTGMLAGLAALSDEARETRTRSFWIILGAALLWMSLDEATSLHEQSGNLLGRLGVSDEAVWHPSFRWLLLGAPAAAVMAFVLLPGFLRIDPILKLRIFWAGAIYVLGAVGLELVGSIAWATWGGSSVQLRSVTTAEEGLEILGLTLLLTGLLDHQARRAPRLDLAPPEAGPRRR